MAAARAGHLSRLSRARVLVHSLRRSEEHTSELSHQIISYAVFCLKKKRIHSSDKHTESSHHAARSMPTADLASTCFGEWEPCRETENRKGFLMHISGISMACS